MNDKLKEQYEDAHEHSSWHREELKNSDLCGCFNCTKVFVDEDIEWFTDRDEDDDEASGKTAICPKCGIDSVIGAASIFSPNRIDHVQYPLVRDPRRAIFAI